MNRQKFIKKGFFGLGSVMATPVLLKSCSTDSSNENSAVIDTCKLSPSETAGPFPIKTPAELVIENIISDRNGIALLINITVQDQSNNCEPLSNVYVDIWHCDADGKYSEYGGTQMQAEDYSNLHFLRGRQLTNENGEVSFISIYPGWYSGRAPHIHLEILDHDENSILVSQIAFPEDISEIVYTTSNYNGLADTSNTRDTIFADSISSNIADTLMGDNENGYTLQKTIIV